jgi:hypothetical protein
VPFPVTITVSKSTSEPPGPISVNVIVPVGLSPPDTVAESFNVVGELPRIANVGLGVVLSDGLAGLTVTCSAGLLISAAGSLFVSPE